MMAAPWQVAAGVALDLAFGDPRWLPHPIRGFGWAANRLERAFRRVPVSPRPAGAFFAVTAILLAAAIVFVTLPWASVFWIWTLLALRGLDVEAGLVVSRLVARDIEGARRRLAMIVGRDTAALDEPEIVRAVVETVAENLNDAVIAPLFYLALAGPAGMAAYKAINTLDSMVGYRNERYREFGWAAARIDDCANFVPARLTALLVWLCALLPGYDAWRSLRVTLRDASSQPSPNAGYPEAAVAGALGVQLGGLNFYGGVPSAKARLGDAVRPIGREAFARARFLLYASSLLMTAVVCGVLA